MAKPKITTSKPKISTQTSATRNAYRMARAPGGPLHGVPRGPKGTGGS
jgi:hypothetical protein